MPTLKHPDLPGRTVTVSPARAAVLARSGWEPAPDPKPARPARKPATDPKADRPTSTQDTKE